MKSFLSKINQADNLALAGKMYVFFLTLYFSNISHHYFFGFIALLIIYGIIEKEFIFKSVFWLSICLLILPGLISKLNITANHAYLTFYVAILFLLAAYFKKIKNEILYKNSKFILGIVMGFAVLQKLLSDTFMSGSSLAYMNYGGGFFTHFKRFFPQNQEIINANLNRISEQTNGFDGLQTTIEFVSPNWLIEFDATLLVWIILLVEIVFCVMLFVKNQYVRNSFFMLFMLGLISFRIETGFASLLCILLLLQAQNDKPIFKLAYIAIFGLFISMILTKLGVH